MIPVSCMHSVGQYSSTSVESKLSLLRRADLLGLLASRQPRRRRRGSLSGNVLTMFISPTGPPEPRTPTKTLAAHRPSGDASDRFELRCKYSIGPSGDSIPPVRDLISRYLVSRIVYVPIALSKCCSSSWDTLSPSVRVSHRGKSEIFGPMTRSTHQRLLNRRCTHLLGGSTSII